MARQGNLKDALISAFEELVAERPLSSITVGDLCKAVGISRNAFYTYFDSKESVLKSIFYLDFVDAPRRLFPLFTENDGEVSALLLMRKSYENILARQTFYSGLEANNRDTDYSPAMASAIRDCIVFTMEERGCTMTEERDYVINFVTTGQVSTIIKWIRSGYAIPVDQMARWYISWTGTAMKVLYDTTTFMDMNF